MDHQQYKQRVREVLQEKGGAVPLAELIDELIRDHAVPISRALISVIDAEGVRMNHTNSTVELCDNELVLT